MKKGDDPPPNYQHLSNFLKDQICTQKKMALSRHSGEKINSINTSISKKSKFNNAMIEKANAEIKELKKANPNRKSAIQMEKLKTLQNAFLNGGTSPSLANSINKPTSVG